MASRTVAGGRARSARPPDSRRARFSDRGSGRGGKSRCLVFDTRPLTGVDKTRATISGGRSLRSDHRLPYETPSGVVPIVAPAARRHVKTQMPPSRRRYSRPAAGATN